MLPNARQRLFRRVRLLRGRRLREPGLLSPVGQSMPDLRRLLLRARLRRQRLHAELLPDRQRLRPERGQLLLPERNDAVQHPIELPNDAGRNPVLPSDPRVVRARVRLLRRVGLRRGSVLRHPGNGVRQQQPVLQQRHLPGWRLLPEPEPSMRGHRRMLRGHDVPGRVVPTPVSAGEFRLRGDLLRQPRALRERRLHLRPVAADLRSEQQPLLRGRTNRLPGVQPLRQQQDVLPTAGRPLRERGRLLQKHYRCDIWPGLVRRRRRLRRSGCVLRDRRRLRGRQGMHRPLLWHRRGVPLLRFQCGLPGHRRQRTTVPPDAVYLSVRASVDARPTSWNRCHRYGKRCDEVRYPGTSRRVLGGRIDRPIGGGARAWMARNSIGSCVTSPRREPGASSSGGRSVGRRLPSASAFPVRSCCAHRAETRRTSAGPAGRFAGKRAIAARPRVYPKMLPVGNDAHA